MYTLRTSSYYFVKEVGRELVITPSYKDAILYDAIGDAMRAAVLVNKALDSNTVSVIRID